MDSLINTEAKLTQRLQELLDLQWDSLVAAKGSSLSYTRHEITHAMSQLLHKVYQVKVKTLEEEINNETRKIQDVKARRTKINDIKELIISETKSEAIEVTDLDQKISTIDEEREQLQKKLDELDLQRKSLEDEKNSVTASIERKSHKHNEELRGLEQQAAKDQDVTLVQARVDLSQRSLEEASSEVNALENGLTLWDQVCALTGTVESGLKLAKSTDELLEILSKAQGELTGYFELASNNSWKLLSIAISHELEAVNRGIQIIKANTPAVPA